MLSGFKVYYLHVEKIIMPDNVGNETMQNMDTGIFQKILDTG